MTRLCLNMIVKNEAERIGRCLASVVDHISEWVIVDTGSTDGTKDVVQRFFDGRGIPGAYIEGVPFVDFGQARNAGLDYAWKNSTADYLLLVDADMEMEIGDPGWASDLTQPAYMLLQRTATGDLSYFNTRLVRRNSDARYIGVTHEYLSFPDGAQPQKLHTRLAETTARDHRPDAEGAEAGGAVFIDHADGSNRADKFDRDIRLLEAGLEREPGNVRYMFYLAQSYRDAGRTVAALNAYAQRVKMGGWDEEVWRARLEEARCWRALGNTDKFVTTALAAFDTRPKRAEPLYDLACYYRSVGQNHLAAMIAERAMVIPRPDDLLFVEDAAYTYGPREEFSIVGYYCGEETKACAAAVCDALVLDRSVPWARHDLAWSNLFFYTRPIAEFAPSFSAKQIDFTPPDGYRPTNPSVVRIGDQMMLNVRAVNYLIGPDGRYIMPEREPDIATRNFLFELNDDLSTELLCEVKPPIDQPEPLFRGCLGFEDMRLFEQGSELWCSATTRQLNPEGWCEIVVARIDVLPGTGRLDDLRVIRPEGPRRNEKNWMPIADGSGRFVYSCDPTRIINRNGVTINGGESTPPMVAREWGGSSQLIPFADGFLALVHERKADPDPMHGQRNYQRRFVFFRRNTPGPPGQQREPEQQRENKDLKIQCTSRRFYFGDAEGEFVCGMCRHPDGRRLIISYGVLDRAAWVATVDIEDVERMLGIEDYGRTVHANAAMVWTDGAKSEVVGPDFGDLAHEINKALLTQSSVDLAGAILDNHELLHHPDRVKDWDTVLALHHTLMNAVPSNIPGPPGQQRENRILDAGASRVSTFLPNLRRLGYTNLIGINLDEGDPVSVDGVTYRHGDITRTYFPDASFSFVACLSVLEHGVDWRAFLREAHRIIRPDGHLFLSVDYWHDPVDTKGQTAFGVPVKVFDADEIGQMVNFAVDMGFDAPSSLDMKCQDRVINWIGMDFTFFNLLLKKPA